VIQDCDTLDLIWFNAAGETALAILQQFQAVRRSPRSLYLPIFSPVTTSTELIRTLESSAASASLFPPIQSDRLSFDSLIYYSSVEELVQYHSFLHSLPHFPILERYIVPMTLSILVYTSPIMRSRNATTGKRAGELIPAWLENS